SSACGDGRMAEPPPPPTQDFEGDGGAADSGAARHVPGSEQCTLECLELSHRSRNLGCAFQLPSAGSEPTLVVEGEDAGTPEASAQTARVAGTSFTYEPDAVAYELAVRPSASLRAQLRAQAAASFATRDVVMFEHRSERA